MSAPPRFVPSGKVLRRPEAAAVRDGAAYAQEARRSLEGAEAAAREAREAAESEGYARGREEGERLALAALDGAVAEARARLLDLEEEIGRVVLAAVERVVGALPERDLARRCLREALRDVAGGVAVTLHAPVGEHWRLRDLVAELGEDPLGARVRRVEADASLRPGEIVIETPHGRVHAGPIEQLARLRGGLTGA